MKLLVALLVLVGGYLYMLLHTTDTVLAQVQQVNKTYQYMADRADEIAAGQHNFQNNP